MTTQEEILATPWLVQAYIMQKTTKSRVVFSLVSQ